MLRRTGILVVFALIVMMASVLQVSADAAVDSYFPGCSSFSASGTTDAPYVAVEIYDPDIASDAFYDTFPATDGRFSLTATFEAREVGHVLEYHVWGATSSDPNDYDGGEYFNSSNEQIPCQQEPPPVKKELGAPGIPSGFVFASIICNTPVYDTPAGQPVGAAAVTAGQTWYVNPTPVDGADGKQWTEIYVSSTTNPYIPTACVQ